MSTESCERCGAAAPEALLRTVELYVDGSEVDGQTICPDCFADWIAHYQEQMAGDMPGADDDSATADDSVDDDSDDDGVDDDVLSEAVRAAQKVTDESTDAPADPAVDDGSGTGGSGGDEIREVSADGAAAPVDGEVEVDLNGETDLDDAETGSDGLIMD